MPPRAAPKQVEDELERLYGLPRDEFTAARDDAARQLRRAGDRAAAGLLAASRKPTAAAWAVNQLARRDPDGVRALLEAGERLRAAGSDRERLRAATQEERAAVNRLAEVAAGFAGRPSDAVREAIRQTLHAAVLDADVRDGIAEGRLTKEARAIGLGSLPLDAGLSATPSAPARRRSPAPKAAEVGKPPRTSRTSKAPAASQTPARRRPTPNRAALREAERRLTSARRRLTRTAAQLEDAEERADEAERELGRRQEALDRAREEEGAAQTELARAIEQAAAAGMRRGDLAKAAGLSPARLRAELDGRG